MTVERVRHSGALVVTELVHDPNSYLRPDEFFHSETFYGYTRDEAVTLYAENLREQGLEVVE